MALGGGLSIEDDGPTSIQPAVVISHHLWQERFGGAGGRPGKRLVVDGRPLTIVGVTPEKFNGAEHAERRTCGCRSLTRNNLPGTNFLENRGTWWSAALRVSLPA